MNWVLLRFLLKCPLLLASGIEIPKYVDKVTPEYKPKFDALVTSFEKLTFINGNFTCSFLT
ncbi:unnamed protein product [Arabidopsis halleri]